SCIRTKAGNHDGGLGAPAEGSTAGADPDDRSAACYRIDGCPFSTARGRRPGSPIRRNTRLPLMDRYGIHVLPVMTRRQPLAAPPPPAARVALSPPRGAGRLPRRPAPSLLA